jgi:hypothetical protein
MNQYVQPLDLAMILQASQNYALKERQDRIDMEARGERFHAMDLEQKRRDLAAKIKMAQSKVLGAQSEADKKTAMGELAATDPASAMSMEKHQLGIEEQQREAEAAQVAQAKAKRAEATQQQLKLAEITRDVLGKSVVKGAGGEEIVSFGNLYRGVAEMKRMAQAGLIPMEPVAALEKNAQEIRINASQASPGDIQAMQKQLVPELRAMQQDADKVIGVFGDPEKMQRMNSEIEQIAGRVYEKTGDSAALNPQVAAQKYHPVYVEAAAELRAEKERSELERAKASGARAIVNMPGASKPTVMETGKLQEATATWAKIGAKAKNLRKAIRPEMFEWAGQGKSFLAWGAEKLKTGMAPEKWNKLKNDRAAARTMGTLMLYDFMVMESGKAVTERERELLLKAFGDFDSMDASQYEEVVGIIEKYSGEEQQRNATLLREGFNTATDEGAKYLRSRRKEIIDSYKAGDMDLGEANAALGAMAQEYSLLFEGKSAAPGGEGSSQSGDDEEADRLMAIPAQKRTAAQRARLEELMR